MRRPVKAPGPAPKATASSSVFSQELLQHRKGELGVAVPGAALEAGDFALVARARPSTTRWRFRSPRIACAILYTAAIMREHSIAVIPGDGIGREVIPEGVRVLEAVGAKHGLRFKWQEFPWNCDWYKAHGKMCPDDAPDILRKFDAIYFGAVGNPAIVARPYLRVGTADQLPALVRPLRQPAPGAPVRGPALPARRPQARRHRLHRDAREHRGRVRRRRRPRLRKYAERNRHAAGDLLAPRRRPHHEVRVRARAARARSTSPPAPSRTASRSPCRTGTSASRR